MHLAEQCSTRSKDPRTQVGVCIVKDRRVLSMGYNGAPRKFPDCKVPQENSDILMNSKNAFMCHAEINALLNYRGNISDFDGATIYLTLSPCHECIKALAQAGIKEIIYKEPYDHIDIFEVAKYIAESCGIIYRKL